MHQNQVVFPHNSWNQYQMASIVSKRAKNPENEGAKHNWWMNVYISNICCSQNFRSVKFCVTIQNAKLHYFLSQLHAAIYIFTIIVEFQFMNEVEKSNVQLKIVPLTANYVKSIEWVCFLWCKWLINICVHNSDKLSVMKCISLDRVS